MPGIRAVVFDCYGTLVDILTDEGKEEIFAKLALYLGYYGAQTTASALKSLFYAQKERYLHTRSERYPEFDIAEVFRNILAMEGLNDRFLVESCCKIFRLVSREKFQLFEDTLPALKALKSHGYRLAMLSNAQKVFFHEEVEMLGLRHFFNYFIVSSSWGFRKPDPRLFSMSCALLEVPPSEAVYVGDDSSVDVAGAQQAGMKTVLVDRPHRQKDRQPKPDYYTDNLISAWEWIKGER